MEQRAICQCNIKEEKGITISSMIESADFGSLATRWASTRSAYVIAFGLIPKLLSCSNSSRASFLCHKDFISQKIYRQVKTCKQICIWPQWLGASPMQRCTWLHCYNLHNMPKFHYSKGVANSECKYCCKFATKDLHHATSFNYTRNVSWCTLKENWKN